MFFKVEIENKINKHYNIYSLLKWYNISWSDHPTHFFKPHMAISSCYWDDRNFNLINLHIMSTSCHRKDIHVHFSDCKFSKLVLNSRLLRGNFSTQYRKCLLFNMDSLIFILANGEGFNNYLRINWQAFLVHACVNIKLFRILVRPVSVKLLYPMSWMMLVFEPPTPGLELPAETSIVTSRGSNFTSQSTTTCH